MAFSTAIGALFIATALAAAKDYLDPLSDEFISLINSKQDSWVAGRNFPADTSLTYLKGLTGARKGRRLQKLSSKVYGADLIASLPENFDAREKWTNCPSLNEIRNQACCGSCWAFGATEVMTDRVCIHSNGTKQFHFSAQDLTSCCKKCGHGCDGGDPFEAFHYWKEVGIVSGGPYHSSEGCRPYEKVPLQALQECPDKTTTPKCVNTCEANYNVEYKKDKHRAKSITRVIGENNIKAELYTNGPVEAAFQVFNDFPYYKSGVYEHTSGKKTPYGHAVKILGWGIENGKKYWLCANSWGSDWGDLKGFFKFLRGENHLDIEGDVVTGQPDLDGM